MVLVARRPKSGREEEFSRWLLRLNARARMAPGYGESSLHPPNAAHPGEWVIVYRFETTAELQAWLDSPERAALLAEGRDLFVGDAREQVVAHASDEDVVTAVASFRIRPGQELAFEEAQELGATVRVVYGGGLSPPLPASARLAVQGRYLAGNAG